jgi:spermidine synthase
LRPLVARCLVFFTSAAVLVIEILAARLLAPYLGVSLQVFTGVIGVILAGISIGAWLGGRAADRGDPRRLPGPLLMAGGLTAMASPVIIDGIGPTLTTEAGSVVFAAFLGFFLPAALLSAVPPVIVKIQLSSLDITGRVVGSYSALGTAGAILGTFLTGFFLIASFPTRPIVAALGIALAISGVLIWSTRRVWALLGLGAGALLASGLILGRGPCQYETAYHCVVVEVDETRDTGRTLLLDRLRNSYVDLADPTHLEFRYIQVMADVIATHAPEGAIDMVSIGGGGFTLPGYVQATRPGSRNTVLEIDAKLVEIGHEHLALTDDIDVVVDDARISLRDLPAGQADVVIGDAYSGASVPWHLTTSEYTSQISEVMAPGGVYALNVIDYGRLDFVRAEAATLRAVFSNVALFAPPDYVTGAAGGNYVLVASDSPIDMEAMEAATFDRGGIEIGIEGEDLDQFIGDAVILTDDFAPVDQMLGRF